MKIALLIIAILSGFVKTFAQKILQVGDSVPDLAIKNVIQYRDKSIDKENVSLRNFGDKLVILDFGFTHCPGCIEKLPEMIALQDKFKAHFQFYWVTYEFKQAVDDWFGGKFGKGLAGLSIPIITDDKLLHSLFPHSIEPHEVWILDGKVIGITGPDKVNDENIANIVLKKELPAWAEKTDMDMSLRDSALLKFSNSQIPSTTSKYYSAVVGSLPNAKYVQGGIKVDSNLNTKRLYILNQSIVDLYTTAIQRLKYDIPLNKLVILEVNDREQYDHRYGQHESRFGASGSNWDEWTQKYNYSYEAVAPILTPDGDMFEKMRQDLNYYLGLNGRREDRMVNTWAITLLNSDSTQVMKRSPSEGNPKDQIYGNMKVNDVAFNLNDISAYETPIYVDNSGYCGKITIALKGIDINNFEQTKASLNKQGLDLVDGGKRQFTFLVITEVGYKQVGS